VPAISRRISSCLTVAATSGGSRCTDSSVLCEDEPFACSVGAPSSGETAAQKASFQLVGLNGPFLIEKAYGSEGMVRDLKEDNEAGDSSRLLCPECGEEVNLYQKRSPRGVTHFEHQSGARKGKPCRRHHRHRKSPAGR